MTRKRKTNLRYAKGGRFNNQTLADGLRALQIQSNIKTRGLDTLKTQSQQEANRQIQALNRKSQIDARNRDLVYKIEEEEPRKLQAEALQVNQKRLDDQYKRQIRSAENDAERWARLSPTLSKALTETYDTIKTSIDKKNGVKEFNILLESGKLDDIRNYYRKLSEQGTTTKATQQVVENNDKYLKNNDNRTALQTANYLKFSLNSNNRHLHKLVGEYIISTADSIVKDLINYQLTDTETGDIEEGVDHRNIASHIQYRAIELLDNLGINRTSETGLDVQEKFRAIAIHTENQWYLGDRYTNDKKFVGEAMKLVQSAIKKGDYTEAQNQFHLALSTFNTLPIITRSGEYAEPGVINKHNTFYQFALNQLEIPRYASNWDLFREEILGVGEKENNKLGYTLPGLKGEYKHISVLGKFPEIEEELKQEWAKENQNLTAAQTLIKQNKDKVEAKDFLDRLNTNEFENDPEKLWRAFEKNKHNPLVKQGMGEYLGFASTNLDDRLLTNILFTELRAGHTRSLVEAWFSGKQGDQEINWAVDNFKELAQFLGVPINEIDSLVTNENTSLLDLIYGANVLDKQQLHSLPINKEMAAFKLTWFIKNRSQYKTAGEAWSQAKVELNKQLGFKDDGTLEEYGEKTNLRGKGQFLHKQGGTGNNKTMFLSQVGQVFNNTSALEIKTMVNQVNTTKEDKIKYLVETVLNEPKIVTDELLSSILNKPGHSFGENALLKIIKNELDNLGVSNSEFLKKLTEKRVGDKSKFFVQTLGADWCETTYPNSKNISNPSDKIMATCLDKVAKDTQKKPWEVALMLSTNPKAKEWFRRSLQENEKARKLPGMAAAATQAARKLRENEEEK